MTMRQFITANKVKAGKLRAGSDKRKKFGQFAAKHANTWVKSLQMQNIMAARKVPKDKKSNIGMTVDAKRAGRKHALMIAFKLPQVQLQMALWGAVQACCGYL